MKTTPKPHRGLVLLVVLGMLGLFSLLAVTYMVYSGQSRTSGLIINRAKLQNPGRVQFSADIIPFILRGSRSDTSVFTMHSLLGDVYGREAIEGYIRNYTTANPTGYAASLTTNTWNNPPHGAVIVGAQVSPSPPLPSDTTFCKLSLNNAVVFSNSSATQLSLVDDAYNARIFTMLEGPLANQSFRILKYIGYEGGTPEELAYSILIDLSECPTDIQLQGQVSGVGTATGTLREWLTSYSINSLFYNEVGNPYKFLINDAVYNGVGYGLHPGVDGSTDPIDAGGNLSQYWTDTFANRASSSLPRPNGQVVPVGLLPNMDYIKPSNVYGSTNEGIDVPDFRDFWLACLDPDGDFLDQSGNPGLDPREVIPSYHRPELVNYLWQLYESGSGLPSRSELEIRQLLSFVDYACARPLAVAVNNTPIRPGIQTNSGFNVGSTSFGGHSRDYVNIPWPNGESQLRNFLSSLVQGPWDVDNDGDGIAESVWIDPDLPTIISPDGKLLKPMAAVHILDMDNRINANLAGGVLQGLPTYYANAGSGFVRAQSSSSTTHPLLGQGSGLGPGDLSLHPLREFHDSATSKDMAQLEYAQTLMRERHGNDAPTGSNYSLTGVPGRINDQTTVNSVQGGTGTTGDDYASYLHEKGLASITAQWTYTTGGQFVYPRSGFPLMTHGRAAFGLDLNGNVATYRPPLLNPSGTTFIPDEIAEDPYESSQDVFGQDEPFTLEEFERVVRRYDSDIKNLSDRLEKVVRLNDNPSGTPRYSLAMQINDVLTTRSHELRNPPIGFAGRSQENDQNEDSLQSVGNLLEWITLLHEHHFREKPNHTAIALEDAQNDPSAIKHPTTPGALPPLSPDIIKALFPIEFRKGLRMNLNRPFGNMFVEGTGSTYYVAEANPYGSNGVDLPVTVDDPMELGTGNYANEVIRQYPYDGVNHGGTTLNPVQGYFTSLGFKNTTSISYPQVGTASVAPYRTLPAGAPTTPAYRGTLSRQLYARQLYCLAQLLVPQDYRFPSMNGLTPNTGDWYRRRARLLAQWAINVVDFRDSDAIMTRFDYDYLPFGMRAGVPGVTQTPPSSLGFAKDPGWRPEPGDVVWGMEYPELLLTETLAFHDKRVRETTLYPSPIGAKPTQYRIPQGSLFVELYNPRTQTGLASTGLGEQISPAFPKELYVNIGGIVGLDLARLAPNSASYGRQPVWRIGVSESKGINASNVTYNEQLNDATAGGPVSPLAVANTNQSSAEFSATVTNENGQLGDPVIANGLYSDLAELGQTTGTTNPLFERVIWFNQARPSTLVPHIPNLRNPTANIDNKVFYNRVGTAGSPFALPAGSYAVIGPRDETRVGSIDAVDENTRNPIYQPSNQRLELTGTSVEQRRHDDSVANNRFASLIKNSVVLKAQADPPDNTWQGPDIVTFPLAPNEGIGLNVSEPLPIAGTYYPKPTFQLNTTDAGYQARRPDAYADLSDPSQHLDTDILDDNDSDDGTDTYANPNLAQGIWNTHRTHTDFCQLYLQRLADPLQPYDPYLNPYLTIDTMSVDLTLFTGENPNAEYTGVNLAANQVAFESRFKDGRSVQEILAVPSVGVTPAPAVARPSNVGSYFSASTAPMYQTQLDAAAPTYFKFELGYLNPILPTFTHSSVTLGYLNVGHQILDDTAAFTADGTFPGNFAAVPGSFSGFGPPRNPITAPGIHADFRGSSNPRFCMMTSLFWPNRMFANPSELMLVPYTSPGQLSGTFSTLQTPSGTIHPYDSAIASPRAQFNGPFTHLMNFFESSPKYAAEATAAPVTIAMTSNNPRNIPRREPYWMRRNTPSADDECNDLGLLLELVETPPRYAETAMPLDPAAIDVSYTSANATVDAIRNRMLSDYLAPNNLLPTYTNPGKVNINTLAAEPVWNAIEWNIFQSQTFRNTTRGIAGTRWADSATDPSIVGMRRGYPVGTSENSTLNPNINHFFPTQFAGAYRSAFNANITPPIGARTDDYRPSRATTLSTLRAGERMLPLNPPATANSMLYTSYAPADEQQAQPLMTFQRMARLSNLITNQSNVFAVWITVGLFEWDPVNGLGKEYVGPDGKPERQRSFYIIDRTVPVAYREGESFNTEKAILLRRNIAR